MPITDALVSNLRDIEGHPYESLALVSLEREFLSCSYRLGKSVCSVSLHTGAAIVLQKTELLICEVTHSWCCPTRQRRVASEAPYLSQAISPESSSLGLSLVFRCVCRLTPPMHFQSEETCSRPTSAQG